MAGVQRTTSRGLSVLAVLRAVPALASKSSTTACAKITGAARNCSSITARAYRLIDAQTDEPISTELFVAVWGASNYTYAEATLTQQLPDWIGSHVRAFSYFGCVPKIVVPDCLKERGQPACRYEPELNPTYAEMASHYGICVLPARPARPRDKAKVETRRADCQTLDFGGAASSHVLQPRPNSMAPSKNCSSA